MIFGRTQEKKRVAIFGGSFNPPHVGHTAICKWLFARGIADEVWVVPCFIHPFGKELLPFDDRIAMCRLAFNKLGLKIAILDIERELGGVSYTKRTIEELKRRYPNHRFMLVTGDDVQEQTDGWREFGAIREMVDIVRIPRGAASPIPDISSTEVRRRLAERESHAELVENEVAIYIVTKGLFR